MTFRWYGQGSDSISLSDIQQIPGVTGIIWALPVDHPETGETKYLYTDERWGGSQGYFESGYVRLPIAFDSGTKINIQEDCYGKITVRRGIL